MAARVTVIVLFVLLLAAPFLFRPDRPPPPAGARELIVITPHNELIRTEFARGFDAWHQAHYGSRVAVVFSVPGGTSEIRKMLEAQTIAAVEAGREPGGTADVVFGGGSYEHTRLKRGVRVTVDGVARDEAISAPVEFDEAWLDRTYGENDIGDLPLYDPDRYWFGTAVSGFGIVFNRDALAGIGIAAPTPADARWADLCDPRLRGWVALVNPGQSGSITTAFEAILHRLGWEEGWRVLRRAAANARYFSASSLKPPTDVSRGAAAMGVCIDFFGRYEAQAVKVAGGGDRVGYVDPPAATTIDPDPVSMLRGARDPELARRFIEFCVSEAGQALWQFRVDDDGADGLGPEQYELRRLPIVRSMYERHFDRMIDRVNPYEIATRVENPSRDLRSFIAPLFAALAMDHHHDLRRAWEAIVTHPAYPAPSDRAVIVTAADVADPELHDMLVRFDAMPEVATPEGTRSLATTEHLAELRAGWFKAGWSGAALWPDEASPAAVLRRQWGSFFRSQYQAIQDQ